jgi:hypothetical protein
MVKMEMARFLQSGGAALAERHRGATRQRGTTEGRDADGDQPGRERGDEASPPGAVPSRRGAASVTLDLTLVRRAPAGFDELRAAARCRTRFE